MTDTEPPTLVADEPPEPPTGDGEAAASKTFRIIPPGIEARTKRQSWWGYVLAVVSVMILGVIGIASALPASIVAEQSPPEGVEQPVDFDPDPTPFARTPASAQSVADRIVFGDLTTVAADVEVQQYPPVGEIFFVTVTEPEQSVLSWLVGNEEPAVQFLTDEQKFGVQTPQQRRVFALESMRTAEQVAQYVALERVGYDVAIRPGEVLIEQMVCLEANEDGTECAVFAPSDEFLDPGDRLVEVDGVPLDTVDDLTRTLSGKQAGDEVEVVFDRPDVGELTVTIELTTSPSEPERAIVGFVPFDTSVVELPFDLDIDTGSIGGPSAGAAFTLTLIDELTEGEMTGGKQIAVTGTIELDGTIGAIGGLRQKASAVEQAGVDVFLVPASQGEADIEFARAASHGNVEIIPVANVDEALAALERLGGDPVAVVPNG